MSTKLDTTDVSSAGLASPFILAPDTPVIEGTQGIRYDFNDGARVVLPKGVWRVSLIDDDSDLVLFNSTITGPGKVESAKKYFVRFRIKVWSEGHEQPVLDVALNLSGQNVIISFPVGTLGDMIGWFHYAEVFRIKHRCKLECNMAPEIVELFREQYPHIVFSTPKNIIFSKPYATYRIGLFFKGNNTQQPFDFRQVGFHRNAGYILGVNYQETPPRLKLGAPRIISEPYVCIAVQSTCQAKLWNNGRGWNEVIKHLKKSGFRVLCIDRDAHNGSDFTWNHIPHGVEDYTGSRPLQERIDLLQHASFFIGLASGLSWLAWACHIPVVMVSGFSLPASEFYTPWRVISTHGCNGCWDSVYEDFDHTDYFWCPRHKGTERQFECTRLITGKQVINTINALLQVDEQEAPS